ncbi:MAG: alpha-amylase family glycosyl hydrolase, partial [Coprococcus sp.]
WCIYRGKHLMTFADNHDVTRLASILKNKEHLRSAYGILMGMPGIPCLYYGSEWGVEGVKGPHSDYALRPCFSEPKPNELTDWIRRLISLRQDSDALCNGDYRNIIIQNHQLIFERRTNDERILVAINASEQEYTAYHDILNGIGTELITDTEISLKDGLILPPYSTQYIQL